MYSLWGNLIYQYPPHSTNIYSFYYEPSIALDAELVPEMEPDPISTTQLHRAYILGKRTDQQIHTVRGALHCLNLICPRKSNWIARAQRIGVYIPSWLFNTTFKLAPLDHLPPFSSNPIPCYVMYLVNVIMHSQRVPKIPLVHTTKMHLNTNITIH